MLKIRDLGITFIPETMRPPEIGVGGGYDRQEDPAPAPAPCPQSVPGCVPAPSGCQPSPYPKGHAAGGFSPEAVSALKQQLHLQLD